MSSSIAFRPGGAHNAALVGVTSSDATFIISPPPRLFQQANSMTPSVPHVAHPPLLPPSHHQQNFLHSTSHTNHSFPHQQLDLSGNNKISKPPLNAVRDSLEVFVGNLSYFCEEKDLQDLFNQYGNVRNVRMMRSSDGKHKSLMFGFVMLSTTQEAEQAQQLFNGHLFMGRHLRVERSGSGNNNTNNHSPRRHGHQCHVTITSAFSTGKIIKPTEVLLRKFFTRIGSIVDVQVNWYKTGTSPPSRQEGYAFVTFEEQSTLDKVLQHPVYNMEGITLVCTTVNSSSNVNSNTSTPRLHIPTTPNTKMTSTASVKPLVQNTKVVDSVSLSLHDSNVAFNHIDALTSRCISTGDRDSYTLF